MKRFLMIAAFACVISPSASAGEIPTDGSPRPQPQPQPTTTATAPGEIPTLGAPYKFGDSLVQVVLSGLDLVL